MQMFNAPIAGANYAADTRNYPWHRPPEITDYDEGVDYLLTKLNDPETHDLVFSLLEIDTTVSTVVSTLMLQGISRGKFPIDLAILMAGPVARYIGIIADGEGIKYDMGVSNDDRIRITPTALKVALGIIDDDDQEEPEEEPDGPSEEAVGGLMGIPTADEITAASDDEQAAMLGQDGDEEAPAEGDINEEEPVDGLA